MRNEDINRMFDLFATNNVAIAVRPESERKELVFPDDDADFHAYRILLLLYTCGIIKSEVTAHQLIYGRAKFSFYDFLIRYPIYLRKVINLKAAKAKRNALLLQLNLTDYERAIELSSMINYIRGPWDHNYYNVFAYMTSKRLIEINYKKITDSGQRQFCINLTDTGSNISAQITEIEKGWTERMKIINELFREDASNRAIENFIKQYFPELTIGV